ncbi:MAG TPA: GNAT family N-acetyltransferase [Candidatus Limnocylindrales bacterium]|nr:GNAT family N-acetyltransferase [Candidatus Limnocylindrales bacterium]
MMTLHLRYMTSHDIPEVVEIDRQSFDMPWSARSYAFEVTESTYSHMLVLETRTETTSNPIGRLLRRAAYPAVQSAVGAYGGLWFIAGEAHISTIASAPMQRGRGWGELALAAMIRRSMMLHASHIVLEVRVSNFVAQRLYQKYGFETTAIKPHYYSNNSEDAFDMRLELDSDPDVISRFAERWTALQKRHRFEDNYTDGAPPR